MLGGIALPGLETLGWMAGAALVGAGAVVLPGLGRRIKIWRVARLKAKGENSAIEEWELDQYDPHALTEEQQRDLPLTVLGAAIYAALSAWIWRELDQNVGEFLLAGGLALIALFALIGNLRKTDEELGLNVEARDPMQGPPTFMERHGKTLSNLGFALAALGFAWVSLSEPEAVFRFINWMGWVFPTFIFIGFALILLPRIYAPASVEDPDVTVPREAILGALGAVGIVLFLLAAVFWLL